MQFTIDAKIMRQANKSICKHMIVHAIIAWHVRLCTLPLHYLLRVEVISAKSDSIRGGARSYA
jgi:hypothetical protein